MRDVPRRCLFYGGTALRGTGLEKPVLVNLQEPVLRGCSPAPPVLRRRDFRQKRTGLEEPVLVNP